MMKVINVFEASQALQKLPAEFKVIKVELESLKDNTLRRLCRNLEDQHDMSQVSLTDRVSYEDRLVQVLTDGLWDITDINQTMLVLGNKSGLLSGRVFNQNNFEKQLVDHRQFSENYPIFLDTTAVKELETGRSSAAVKRERDQTFTEAPEPQRQRSETISDLKSAWALQETDFNRQIQVLKKQKEDALEQNINLAEEASSNQRRLENQVQELKSKIRDLEVTMMEQDEHEEDAVPHEVVNELRRENDELKEQVAEFQDAETKHAQIMGMSESIMQYDGDDEQKLNYAKNLVNNLEKKTEIYANKWTLNQVGMTPWNPNTTPFLDYLISFRSVMTVSKLPHSKAIQLLFSALPSKFSYLRGIVNRHPDYDSDDYHKTESLLVKMIVGGKEKIFTDFVSLQKKSHETLLEYFQKVCDYYLFSYSDARKVDRDAMDGDNMAFKLVKDKMVKAYPNRMVSEFKRRLESKTKLTDIFEVILEMKDQFPEFEYEKDYSGNDLNALNQKKSDWKKNVKCFRCKKKGHLKKDCYAKRESKTKKSGSSK